MNAPSGLGVGPDGLPRSIATFPSLPSDLERSFSGRTRLPRDLVWGRLAQLLGTPVPERRKPSLARGTPDLAGDRPGLD